MVGLETKKCPQCGEEKGTSEFTKSKWTKDGYNRCCKICTRQNGASYYRKNRETIRNKHAKHRSENRGYFDAYRERHREEMRLYAIQYREKLHQFGPVIEREEKKCSACKEVKGMNGFSKNPSSPDGHCNECKSCIKNNPTRRVRDLVYRALRNHTLGKRKTKKTREYGIDVKLIADALGPVPAKDYHIDHILPLYAFDYSDPMQIRASWHPANLQWLTKTENLKKGTKYNQDDFDRYMKWYLTECA